MAAGKHQEGSGKVARPKTGRMRNQKQEGTQFQHLGRASWRKQSEIEEEQGAEEKAKRRDIIERNDFGEKNAFAQGFFADIFGQPENVRKEA